MICLAVAQLEQETIAPADLAILFKTNSVKLS